MGKIREGRWDCDSCGNVNLGRFERCRSCGSSRESNVAFYLPHGEPAITDEELIADALSGPDWHCDHCDSSNKAMDSACVSCGDLRDQHDKIHDRSGDRLSPPAGRPIRQASIGRAPMPSSKMISKHEHEVSRGPAPREARNSGGSRKSISETRKSYRRTAPHVAVSAGKLSIGAAVIAFVMAAILLILSFTMNFEKHQVITDLSWERSIGLERIVALDESGWSLPHDAYDVSRDRRIRDYETVTIGYRQESRTETERFQSGTETYTCGQESLGNGYFRDKTCSRPTYSTRPVTRTISVPITEQRPIWDTWYEYSIDRWREVRRVQTAGGDTAPYWPEIDLASGEREGRRAEAYRFEGAMDDERKTGKITYEEWVRLDVGSIVVIVTNFWGTVKSVSLD